TASDLPASGEVISIIQILITRHKLHDLPEGEGTEEEVIFRPPLSSLPSGKMTMPPYCGKWMILFTWACFLPWAGLKTVSGQEQQDPRVPSGAYQAPSPEPIPWETLILEYINRCRANPAEDAERCIATKVVPKSVDQEMFRREMYAEPPAPPLVFDLKLLQAARAHSYYQIINGQTHEEIPDKPGFTGRTPSDRAQAAGFPGGAAENIFRDAHDPWFSHAGFVVDWGDGPGGMQPERGHRKNILNRDYRVAGCGAVVHVGTKTFAVTHNFAGSSQRLAGGVMIQDANKNGMYDIGEGVSGIEITVADSTLRSWDSGAYSIPIPESAAKATFEIGGKRYATYFPEGKDNIKFDVNLLAIDQSTRLTTQYKRIAAMPDTHANQVRRFNMLVDLILQSQGILLEDAIIEDMNQLTAPIRDQIKLSKEEALGAVESGSLEKTEEIVLSSFRKFSHTPLRAWFEDAKRCLEMRKFFEQLSNARVTGKRLDPKTLERAIHRQMTTFQGIRYPEWKKVGYQIGEKTVALSKTNNE
ncbi:MAG: CAP domain-containing protein, partial [Pirellulales bacterium]|nr:CAP domain-containing protein [Pirellulales bacterium]